MSDRKYPIQVQSFNSPTTDETCITVKFSSVSAITEAACASLMTLIVREIAERYVNEKFGEIAAKLDQNAIANLAIAEAAKKIAEEIQRQPNIVEKTKVEVYQRGLLGGLTKIR